MFPIVEGVPHSKLATAPDTHYSASGDRGSRFLCEVSARYVGWDAHITDCTANAGCDSIQLSRVFAHVNAIEINPSTYRALTHNVRVYARDNITTYYGNAADIITRITQDVCYVDPPWGGTSYKAADVVDLYLDGLEITEFYKKYAACARYWIFKLPINYNRAIHQVLQPLQMYPFIVKKNIKFYIAVYFRR